MLVQPFVILLGFVMKGTLTSASTNSLLRNRQFTPYPLGSGYIQRPLNTPANTNGKVRHSYYLVPGNGNYPPAADSQDEPQRTPTTAGLLDSTQLYTNRDQSASDYQSREGGRSGSNSGSSEYGFTSMTRSSNFGSGGGEEAIFRNEENGAAYEDYRVIFRGSLFDNRGNERRAANSLPLLPAGGCQQAPRPGVGKLDWHTVREVVMKVSNRAFLEEADSDVTGLTKRLYVPRCSYVPIREECRGHVALRTIDGTCNNLQRPLWGSSFQPFKRYLRPHYEDGVASPRTNSKEVDKHGRPRPLPNPRLISRTVHLIKEAPSQASSLLMQFGQFVDHDITGTSSTTDSSGAILCCGEKRHLHENCLPIAIPPGDTHFTDRTCIHFVRSLAVADQFNNTLVPREQRNEVTSFLDASVVYGSAEDQTVALRTFRQGLLRASDGNMLPLEAGGCVAADRLCLVAGDTRVNEVPGLGSLHLLFHHQHNRLARALSALLPGLTGYPPHVQDEALFQTARRILAAQLQHIVYTQWLPLILGPFAVSHYGLDQRPGSPTYDSGRDPRVANVFATAAFRFGHSLVPSALMYGDRPIPLHKVFNNPKWVREDVDKVLKGLLLGQAQVRDQFFVAGLRNRLFESAPKTGLDLMALNIQRGRDHGLAPFNDWRELCGLPRVYGFNDTALGTAGPSLREVYLTVDDIDLFTGAMCEPPMAGGVVGPTLACLIGRQFADLKAGDRFFYQTTGPEGFTPDQLRVIGETTMAGLICANTRTLASVQQNPFIQLSKQNPPVACNDATFQLSLEPWRQELQRLLYLLSPA